MDESNENLIYAFGDFCVDIRKRQICRDEKVLPLTAKAFDTLAALLASNGETVSKTVLMDIVWPETAVEENNLTQQISALRKLFGERAADHKFIVTVPGRGYRFVASVRKIDASDDKKIIESAEPNVRSRTVSSIEPVRANALFGYALAVAYVLVVCLPAFVVTWRAEGRGIKPQSIAILRFRSAGVGDELLGMGIRDTLRAKLGNLDELTVRPAEPIVSDDVVDAGKQMDVDVVVTGSIQHDEDKVRVAVEVVDVTNRRIIWGNTFDDSFSSSFELQDSISEAVLSALRRPKFSGALHRPDLVPGGDRATEEFVINRSRNVVRPDRPPDCFV